MKKLLTLTAVGALFAAPATAVQKCVALTPGIQGTPRYNSNRSEWSVDFPGVTVKGIAVLVDTVGNSRLETKSDLPIGMHYAPEYYCWCRLISPVVSDWVYTGNSDDATTGDMYVLGDLCAYHCAEPTASKLDFQNVIFKNLSD